MLCFRSWAMLHAGEGGGEGSFSCQCSSAVPGAWGGWVDRWVCGLCGLCCGWMNECTSGYVIGCGGNWILRRREACLVFGVELGLGRCYSFQIFLFSVVSGVERNLSITYHTLSSPHHFTTNIQSNPPRLIIYVAQLHSSHSSLQATGSSGPSTSNI